MSYNTETYNYCIIKELETLCSKLKVKLDLSGRGEKFLIDINRDRNSFFTAENAVQFLKGILSERTKKTN
jgi:hypothetical protein